MNKLFTEDQLNILEVVAKSSQPIVVKGAVGAGKSTLSEVLNELNPERTHVYDGVSTLGFLVEDKKELIKRIEKNRLILVGIDPSKWLENLLGDHIQIIVYKLPDQSRTFKVNFVSVPFEESPKVNLTPEKNVVMTIRDDVPPKSELDITITHNGEKLKHDIHIHVTTEKEIGKAIEFLITKGKIQSVASFINSTYTSSPTLITLYPKSILHNLDARHGLVVKDEINELIELASVSGEYVVIAEYGDGPYLEVEGVEVSMTLDFRNKSSKFEDIENRITLHEVVTKLLGHGGDIIVVNNANATHTNLFDALEHNAKLKRLPMACMDMDNYFMTADSLNKLIEDNDRVVISTSNRNTAYEEMLTNPIKVVVTSFKDEEQYEIM